MPQYDARDSKIQSYSDRSRHAWKASHLYSLARGQGNAHTARMPQQTALRRMPRRRRGDTIAQTALIGNGLISNAGVDARTTTGLETGATIRSLPNRAVTALDSFPSGANTYGGVSSQLHRVVRRGFRWRGPVRSGHSA